LQKEKEKADLIEFLNMNLVMKERNRWNWFFIPGEFPKLVWEKPCLADKVLGSYQIKVKWFAQEIICSEQSAEFIRAQVVIQSLPSLPFLNQA